MKKEDENFVKFCVWENSPLSGWDLSRSLENVKLVHVDIVVFVCVNHYIAWHCCYKTLKNSVCIFLALFNTILYDIYSGICT